MGEEDGERFDFVAVGGQPVGEFVGQGFGVGGAVLAPAGVGDAIQIVVVDGLFFFAADGVDQFDEFAVHQRRRFADQLLLGLVAQRVAGVVADGQAGQFEGAGFDEVAVDGVEQFADEVAEFDAAGRFAQAALVVGVELLVEPGQTAGQRADTVSVIGGAHHDAHGQVFERHAGLGDERLAGGFERFGDADGIDDDVVGLGAFWRRA